ncbi:MAG: hypothetical protein ABIY70_25605 [Capsulimonas sp.]|uniref:hypothetical protein n=1 Tax=Capsulimonas sp. TaxID=2494211 RepID=UPI003264256A
MNDKLYCKLKFRGAALKFVLTTAVSVLVVAGLTTQAHAVAPSFTFAATIPAAVLAGSTFTFPASVTNIGGQATDYNTYFQIYDLGFNYQGQTYYTNQTFAPGETINYNVAITAPTTPGTYLMAALMFNKDYTGGIISQTFFPQTFQVLSPAAVPEPSSGAVVGLFLVGALLLNARRRGLRA